MQFQWCLEFIFYRINCFALTSTFIAEFIAQTCISCTRLSDLVRASHQSGPEQSRSCINWGTKRTTVNCGVRRLRIYSGLP